MTIAGGHAFVVLAYGDSPFLRGCLKTLRTQTRPSRITISTSTPSPAIEAAAKESEAELRVNPERAGIGRDWNFALRATGCRYITLVHQDDTYAPTFLERTLDAFACNPEGVVAFTGYQEVDDEGQPVSSKISKVKHLIEAATLGGRVRAKGLGLRAFLSFGNPLPCSSVTFDLGQLPDFAFDEAFASNLDWEAWWRLHQEGRLFLHVPERLVGRRHNDQTETSRLIAGGRRQAEDAAMFGRIWPRPLDRVIASLYLASYR